MKSIFAIANTKILHSIQSDLKDVTKILVDNSPTVFDTANGSFAGTPSDPVIYANGQSNIVGDFKNSWSINENTKRNPDANGFDSINVSSVKAGLVNFGDNTIQNGCGYARNVNENHKVIEQSKGGIIALLRSKYKGGK